MYIAPNTTIRLLKDVPLDTTYDHTIYFINETLQANYFSGLTKYTLNQQSYQRVNKGKMRVNLLADNLYDCNYLMFKNTSFGDKWFYAFIVSVEYINNNCTEITYQIDVMQTWFFDYELEQCFVEREHTDSDNLFEHIEPENLEIGDEYVCLNQTEFDMNNMAVCMLISKTKDQANYQGSTRNGIYTPLRVIAGVSATDPSSIDYLINSYVEDGQEDRVVAIYQYPAWLGDATTTAAASNTFNVTQNTTQMAGGYTPKNKKLFSDPYSCIIVSNNNGQTAKYKWEDWGTGFGGYKFKIVGVFISTPCVMVYPVYYRGINDDFDSGLTLSSFPQCAWVGDAFKAWWAQNRASFVTGTIASTMAAGVTVAATAMNPALGLATAKGAAATMAAVGAGVGAASIEANVLGKITDMKNAPPQVHGQTQTDSLNAGIGRFKFSFYQMTIKPEYARMIDDYFSRFGYACRKTKVPNRGVRPHWCYTKTIGCAIKGSIPADDARTICGIYDAGITFWRNGNNVGNYSLDNSPQNIEV